MNTEFIRSFAMLFGATIALICAIYVWIGYKRKMKRFAIELLQNY